MTCIALGIILSVTKKEEEIAEVVAEEQKRAEALKRIIDKQLQEDEEASGDDYSIEDTANPMNALLKKQ
jgi:cell division protein FtsW